MNKRRKVILAFAASAFVYPVSALAQPATKVWRVGFLSVRDRPKSFKSDVFGAFLEGMSGLGYVEGKNLIVEWRFAEGADDRLPGLTAELLQSKVDVILAAGTPSTAAAQKTTTTIPIVMASVNDPVRLGFVKSLSHPGGNITGLANLNSDLIPKQLEILRRMAPKLSRATLLTHPGNTAHTAIAVKVQSAGKSIGIKVMSATARTSQEIETAFAAMTAQKAGAVIVAADQYFRQQRSQIAELALKHRLLSILPNQEFAEAGGLMSYGPNVLNNYRRAAIYVDKILKGARPSDLPVEQPTKFELIINGKTAGALGLKIPQSLLISADKVIE